MKVWFLVYIQSCTKTFLVVLSACVHLPDNTRRWPNVGLLLGHRLRRWRNIKPALGQHRVFTGLCHSQAPSSSDRSTVKLVNIFWWVNYRSDTGLSGVTNGWKYCGEPAGSKSLTIWGSAFKRSDRIMIYIETYWKSAWKKLGIALNICRFKYLKNYNSLSFNIFQKIKEWHKIAASSTTIHTNVGLMLAHRLRWWANIKPTLKWMVVLIWLEFISWSSQDNLCWTHVNPSPRLFTSLHSSSVHNKKRLWPWRWNIFV